MKLPFSWKQLCGTIVALALVALVIVHSWRHEPVTNAQTLSRSQVNMFPQPSLTTGLDSAHFEAGMIFPRWGASAYSAKDANWLIGLHEIAEQTSASWLSLTINFHQASELSTHVAIAPDTPTPASIASGIHMARELGYHVFIIPLITLDSPDAWAGTIHFSSQIQEQAWFDSYWQALKPYLAVAQQEGAGQISIGNEYEQLQQAPSFLWQQLLTRTRQVFSGSILYDVNWTSLSHPIPSWMRDSRLSAIGVSAYVPLVSTPQRLNISQLPALWKNTVGQKLDRFAQQLGKPILLSELGYRDTAFAGYKPEAINVKDPRDDLEQAALFDAAMRNIVSDPYIVGVFVWAWSFPPFAPNGKLAAQILHRWYAALRYADRS